GLARLQREAAERERRLAEEAHAASKALRVSEERYRSFIRHSSEGIWRFEVAPPIPIGQLPSGTMAAHEEDALLDLFYERAFLAECNDAMARMYGHTSADGLLGARLEDLVPRADPRNTAFLRAFIRSGFRLHDAESHEVGRDGRARVFLNNFTGVVE